MKTHLIIHHSGTTDGATLSVPVIRKNHMAKGWVNIGYHICFEWVDRPGDTPGYYEAILGRPYSRRAAGEPQQGMNRKGIHCLFVGNYDLAEPPQELWKFAMPHLACLMDQYEIAIDNVVGHREIGNVGEYKQCPGKHWNMHRFRAMLGGQP